MIDPITSRPAGVLVAEIQQSAHGVDYGPGVVSEQDRALFLERLNAPVAEVAVTVDVSASVQQETGWVLPAPPTPAGVLSVGDRILQSMNSFQDSWSNTVESMQLMTSQVKLEPAEMLSIQFQMGYSSMMLSTISQEVGSISQKIDGLLKTG
ncbi:MAG: hypothetical protein AAGC95_01405 [Pseudomonadota bacterium]